MEVTEYADNHGKRYREIIESNFNSLKELEQAYMAKGWRIQASPFTIGNGKWILTVEVPSDRDPSVLLVRNPWMI